MAASRTQKQQGNSSSRRLYKKEHTVVRVKRCYRGQQHHRQADKAGREGIGTEDKNTSQPWLEMRLWETRPPDKDEMTRPAFCPNR